MNSNTGTSPEAAERFTPDVIGSKGAWPDMAPHKTGGYVRYEDYAALSAERDALKVELAEAKMLLSHMVNHAEWLEKNEYFFWEATDKVRAFLARHHKEPDA